MKINDFNFAGHKAIVRVDFNVPLDENGNVTDDTRIRGALPTLKKILADGGALIMMSHMGKPKGKVKPELSLSQIVKNVSKALGVDVKFAKDAGNAEAEAAALKGGEALLLENLRYYPEEEGKPVGVEKGTPEYDAAKKEMKERQKEFAKKLASYADVYVNDAFGTAHRKHASTAVIADYFDADHKMLGYLMEKEVTAIENVLKNAKHPFTAIIGGSKVSSKLGVIKNLLDKVDNLIIGGGMGYTFIKAQGGKIGKSLHEDDLMPEALNVIAAAKEKGVNLSLSVATVCGKDFSNDTERKVFPIDQIPDEWEGMDASEESIEAWKKIIMDSKTILWNGPVGVFEFENFAKGTGEIAKAVAQATQENGAYSLVGGGDSVAAVNKFGLADKVSYVSTGGGAMLEAIEGKVLPGVAAIEK
ncbi:phosphoglycerate kinase [Prevotella histicola]|jgi:phosphoglycerate kinase|uniref:Phosphoglycerate kinase n=5 Tax=Prevotella TaxID=838 RepID=G6AGS6_9BACT|nr:phosphoglycerate kinase [Prevotella histicola]EHG16110.1 phosphoglycerate kinase [Prevotella histicola F0411]KGF24795.1 phosphoglycerate kinase [Prevotella histicola JCM 15637 = DNF00424]MBF1391340.1 phosphoglycerate kinase [Prevotella histicola]MBF1398541.1 phosphoglycerate kinase [Prevotella histicola]MBF1399607.1 phosphoglycerate kinase [Prevotella histicola]